MGNIVRPFSVTFSCFAKQGKVAGDRSAFFDAMQRRGFIAHEKDGNIELRRYRDAWDWVSIRVDTDTGNFMMRGHRGALNKAAQAMQNAAYAAEHTLHTSNTDDARDADTAPQQESTAVGSARFPHVAPPEPAKMLPPTIGGKPARIVPAKPARVVGVPNPLPRAGIPVPVGSTSGSLSPSAVTTAAPTPPAAPKVPNPLRPLRDPTRVYAEPD
jgi:hypothetical protein